MNIFSSIQSEGLKKTIKYIGYAGWDEVKTETTDAVLDLIT